MTLIPGITITSFDFAQRICAQTYALAGLELATPLCFALACLEQPAAPLA
jgi:hypothetical protein